MNLSSISLRARIYLSMLAFITLSFLAIGGFTYSHFRSQNEAYHQDMLHKKESAVIKSIGYFLEKEGIYENPDSIVVAFSDKITELADINDLDINIFNLKGELLISTHSTAFHEGFFVFNVNDSIMNDLKRGTERVVINEQVDTLHILSAYRYMTNVMNEPIAIINLPYLREKDTGEHEINVFLTRLSEIYILLFIAGSFIAFFLSRYITNLLDTIAKRIQRIDLGKKNEPIQWDKKDEIGTLVREYNRMLAELEKSAELLAQSERELAWREMAKQVAHEIKNPLTPMKLSVQHLQRSLHLEGDDKEKFSRFADSLIQQIDELSNIASAFSNFAKMPTASIEKVDLKEVLQQSIDLFQETIKTKIKSQLTEESAIIFADRGQVSRAINNVIKNALQAMEDIDEPELSISLKREQQYLKLSFSDNGAGMNEESLKNAFMPNFTTKTSGMGLGLPMVKSIVENVGGKVDIQSKERVGTTVSIYFPIVELSS